MPHSPEEKKRVLARVRRVRGQLDALEKALEEGAECGPVLQQIAAIRGAVNGLMAGVLESHLREEFTGLVEANGAQHSSIDEVISLVRTYLK
jgi:DNA-binding FrmR family transcriptional regulator